MKKKSNKFFLRNNKQNNFIYKIKIKFLRVRFKMINKFLTIMMIGRLFLNIKFLEKFKLISREHCNFNYNDYNYNLCIIW